MNCEAVRERLLEVDLQAPGTELERHLQGCDDCRTVAEQFRAAERDLDHALHEVRPRFQSDEAVAIALSGFQDSLDPASTDPSHEQLPRDWKRLARWAPLPLAAAAGLAGLLLNGGPASRAPVGTLASGRPAAVATDRHGFQVEVPSDRKVAVFETRDPAITVVWFLDGPAAETTEATESAESTDPVGSLSQQETGA